MLFTLGVPMILEGASIILITTIFTVFPCFVYLQLMDGLDVLERNILSSLKQDFIANKLIGTYRNLTAQDFIRSGKHRSTIPIKTTLDFSIFVKLIVIEMYIFG